MEPWQVWRFIRVNSGVGKAPGAGYARIPIRAAVEPFGIRVASGIRMTF
jgi:hypothetical protein